MPALKVTKEHLDLALKYKNSEINNSYDVCTQCIIGIAAQEMLGNRFHSCSAGRITFDYTKNSEKYLYNSEMGQIMIYFDTGMYESIRLKLPLEISDFREAEYSYEI